MPYKTYQVGAEDRTARLLLHYSESDAVNKRLQQRMDQLADYLVLTRDITAKVTSDAKSLVLEADWNKGDYYILMRGRNGISEDISCRLLPEGFAVTIREDEYILKRK